METEKRDRNIRLLDLDNWRANIFQVTDEFTYTNGTYTIRADIVFLIKLLRSVETFDPELLKQPAAFRAEVIVHELLHLRIPNHGPLFKAIVKAYLAKYGVNC